jgi:hypothetical protein
MRPRPRGVSVRPRAPLSSVGRGYGLVWIQRTSTLPLARRTPCIHSLCLAGPTFFRFALAAGTPRAVPPLTLQAINRWQTHTALPVCADTLVDLAQFASEFLVHAADVEGRCTGIDAALVAVLASSPVPVTYAGGANSIDDLALVCAEGKPSYICLLCGGSFSSSVTCSITTVSRPCSRCADAQVERLSGGRVDLTIGRHVGGRGRACNDADFFFLLLSLDIGTRTHARKWDCGCIYISVCVCVCVCVCVFVCVCVCVFPHTASHTHTTVRSTCLAAPACGTLTAWRGTPHTTHPSSPSVPAPSPCAAARVRMAHSHGRARTCWRGKDRKVCSLRGSREAAGAVSTV